MSFFGRVVGQAFITVYSEICSGNYQEHTASITTEQTTESSKLADNEEEVTQFRKANDIGPDQTSQTTKQHNLQPEGSSSQPVYRIDPKGPNNSLNCYERLADDQSEECFLNVSSMSAATAKTLSSSNSPSSGVLRASLKRALSLLLLPNEWRDIPINSISA